MLLSLVLWSAIAPWKVLKFSKKCHFENPSKLGWRLGDGSSLGFGISYLTEDVDGWCVWVWVVGGGGSLVTSHMTAGAVPVCDEVWRERDSSVTRDITTWAAPATTARRRRRRSSSTPRSTSRTLHHSSGLTSLVMTSARTKVGS